MIIVIDHDGYQRKKMKSVYNWQGIFFWRKWVTVVLGGFGLSQTDTV